MNVAEFISKWKKTTLTEKSASQQHFLDLCELLEHPKPAKVDPTGDSFTFEKGVAKHGGGDGWADVWKKGFFGWEYKGKHKDLAAAYDQLQKYREALENPPLLVVCDMDRFEVHTNFTATAAKVHKFSLDDLDEPGNLEVLRAVFNDPAKLRPENPSEAITKKAAERVAGIAQSLQDRGLDPHDVAHFLDRIVFSFFAEDIELLPEGLFTRVLEKSKGDPARFTKLIGQLFEAMADGGDFGVDEIKHFNGNLFTKGEVLELTEEEMAELHKVAEMDWSTVDPSVFGTLFERGMDPEKRSQLGAHYTSREDIETLVDPVVMAPLRREWQETLQVVENLLRTGKNKAGPKRAAARMTARTRREGYKHTREAFRIVQRFHDKLTRVHVLDPACGSGNFLYVALQKIKDLEKEVIRYATDAGLGGMLPLVGPWQLHGIEVSPYAHDLAQMTVWIGYLQRTRQNGFVSPSDPVLRKMDSFKCTDAIMDLTDPEKPREPEWPKVDFIVGNPPFLGGKLLRRELGDKYVDKLHELWGDEVPREADLCCYWFEKARKQIQKGKCGRAGLLATQGIRGGANREVLKRIKETGDIFFAESDRPWVLDGANVHVSMVGFDDGEDSTRVLDSETVSTINPNLAATADISGAKRLSVNARIAFMGTTKGGAFDIPKQAALELLSSPTPHGVPHSEIVVPWINGKDLTGRARGMWIIDFGVGMEEAEAAKFEAAFGYVQSHVSSARKASRTTTKAWWLHERPRGEMRTVLKGQARFICTARVSKHRLFVWQEAPTLPDSATFVFARSDDYFFGVLHSRLHEVWALKLGTRLETRPRYTPTTCFETFPFPEPSEAQKEAIASAAKDLNELRDNWLNPSEWTREEILEFPASADGPWARYVADPDAKGIGTARYPRTVPHDDDCAKKLKKRTLTNLYNGRPTWLDNAHGKLDTAVFAAYGWDATLSDEDILEKLLELNLSRAD